MERIRKLGGVAKAVAAGVGAAAAYLAGVVPSAGGFTDVTMPQWLILVTVVLGAYGVTWRIPNKGTLSGR